MSYIYNGFIPQNVAPKGAKRIGVYDSNGNRLGGMRLDTLSRPTETKLYSYGLLSDLHCAGNNSTEGTRLNNALTYFEGQGCSFCCHAGDMTNVGFWSSSTATEMYTTQMQEYKDIRSAHPNLHLFGVCGNHESYYKAIADYEDDLEEYAGHPLYYKHEHTAFNVTDIFIFIGQPAGNTPMSDEALQWLYETLETHRNQRCFVFVHPFVSDNDSGNPYGVYGNKIFDWWGTKTTVFKNLMSHYKNTVLFHGHSHMKFEMQEQVKNAIYSTALGFHSVHVPSISWNRKIINGEDVKDNGVGSSCSGYLVDVYENHVVLNGLDLLTNKVVPIGTYCIDTTLQTIEANTFTDGTGTITT